MDWFLIVCGLLLAVLVPCFMLCIAMWLRGPVCLGEYRHDWEVVKAWSEYRCLMEAYKAIDGRELRFGADDIVTRGSPVVRVCLRCGKVEDAITPTVERLERERRNELARTELAKSIYEQHEKKASAP